MSTSQYFHSKEQLLSRKGMIEIKNNRRVFDLFDFDNHRLPIRATSVQCFPYGMRFPRDTLV